METQKGCLWASFLCGIKFEGMVELADKKWYDVSKRQGGLSIMKILENEKLLVEISEHGAEAVSYTHLIPAACGRRRSTW